MASALRDALGKAAHLEVLPRVSERHETIASLALWPWVAMLNKHELPIEDVAHLAHVSVAELRNPDARIVQSIGNRIAELAFHKAGSGAAMEASLMVERGHFALIELLARSSATVGEAMKLVCQFFPLVQDDAQLQLEVRADGSLRLRFEPDATYLMHHGFIELAFAVILLAIRRESEHPALEPVEVWFQHRAPVDRRAFETVLGPHVRFDMPEHHIAFERKVAGLPLTRRNSDVHEAAIQAARDMLKSD